MGDETVEWDPWDPEGTDVVVAVENGAVLLDNMSPEEPERAVDHVDDAALTEASGGLTVADVPAYAANGVDVISMRALTHSAPTLDCSSRTG